MNFQIVTKGFGDTARTFMKLELTVDSLLSQELRIAAEPVRDAAKQKAARWGKADANQVRTAAGIRIARHTTRATPLMSNQVEVRVEQSGPKSSNIPLRRPKYGGVQMRHFFEPALAENENEVMQGVEVIIDGLIAEAMIMKGIE